MVQVVNESQHDNFTESVVLYHPRYLDIYISTINNIYNIYTPVQARPPRPQPHLLRHQPRAARPHRAGGLPQPRDIL